MPAARFALPFGGLLLAAVTVASTLFLRWPAPHEVSAPAVLPGVPARADSAPVSASAPVPAVSVAVPASPGNDQAPRIDAQGNLRIEPMLRSYFDEFLRRAGQAGLEPAVQALIADAGGRLQEPALGQLSHVLEGYLAYLQAGLSAPAPMYRSDADPHQQLQDQRERFAMRAEWRRRYLGDAASAFFGMEEAQERFVLDSLELQQRDDLGAAERARAERALRAQLPAALRAPLEQQAAAEAEATEVQRLQASGADEAALRALLARRHDEATVERLLNEQRGERGWQQRYADYRQELLSLNGSGLSDEALQSSVAELRQRRFRADEAFRVQAEDARLARAETGR